MAACSGVQINNWSYTTDNSVGRRFFFEISSKRNQDSNCHEQLDIDPCDLKGLAIRPAKTNHAFAVSPDYRRNGYLHHRLPYILKVAMSSIESSNEIRRLRTLQVFCPVVFTCFANDENCGEGAETCHETRAFNLLADDGGPNQLSDCGEA